MSIEVKYFGIIEELVGNNSEFIDKSRVLNISSTSKEVFIELYPQLKGVSFQIAVDKALNKEITNESKEIALLPPFAGG
jgi:molybdopterin converting factor small subunit